MIRVTLILLLAFANSSAMAEWLEVGQSGFGNNESTTYVNPATIIKKGSLVTMWVLFDYSNVQTDDVKPYISVMTLTEFDCIGEQSRRLTYSNHSEKMGHGEITSSHDIETPKWQTILPNSVMETVWKYACGKWYTL